MTTNMYFEQNTTNAQHNEEIRQGTTERSTSLLPAKAQKRGGLLKRLRVGIVAGSLLMVGLSALPAIDHTMGQSTPSTANTHVSYVTNEQTTGIPAYSLFEQPAQATTIQMAPVAATAGDYPSIARQAAARAGINPNTFVSQIQAESGFNPHAVSGAGAIGIAQFMPGTAAGMGVNPYDPVSALHGSARLMANLNRQFGGDYAKALAAYNAGPGAVQRAVRIGGGNWLAMMPSETQHYVHRILG